MFDYLEPPENYDSRDQPGLGAFRENAASAGEPWVSFFDPGQMAELLAELGFEDIIDADSDALAARYFGGRSDSLVPRGPMHCAVATR